MFQIYKGIRTRSIDDLKRYCIIVFPDIFKEDLPTTGDDYNLNTVKTVHDEVEIEKNSQVRNWEHGSGGKEYFNRYKVLVQNMILGFPIVILMLPYSWLTLVTRGPRIKSGNVVKRVSFSDKSHCQHFSNILTTCYLPRTLRGRI